MHPEVLTLGGLGLLPARRPAGVMSTTCNASTLILCFAVRKACPDFAYAVVAVHAPQLS